MHSGPPERLSVAALHHMCCTIAQVYVVAKRMGKQPKGLTIATFHSLGLRMVREEAKTLG